MVSHRSDRIADAVRLLAACAAAAADATAMRLLGSGPGVCDGLKMLAAAPPPGIERLAGELAAAARAQFAAARDAPPDAEALYLQMVEAGLLTPAEITACGADAAALAEAMLGKLTDREHRSDPMPTLFCSVTTAVLTRLFADRNLAADLTPGFLQGMFGQLAGLAERLDHLARPEMVVLADRFEIERVHALSDADLRAVLEKRAEDHRNLREQIAAMQDRGLRTGNVLAKVESALGRLDLAAADMLLATEPLEQDTRIMQARADLALLRGRTDEAFAILESFRSVNPLDATQRHLANAARLRAHGIRYGGAGLVLSARMVRLAFSGRSTSGAPPPPPDIRTRTQNSAGDILQMMGGNFEGAAGAALLAEAADVYRGVLRVWTEDAHPLAWAKTQNNLGLTLRAQGSRVAGAPGVLLFGEAAAAFRAALRVRTADVYAADWAETQNNLGLALRAQGCRIGGAAGAALLGEAVEAYRAALRAWDEDDPRSLAWAKTQNNLGTALQAQGSRIGGAEGALLLSRAVDAYRAALQVWTEDAHAVDWAATQSNLAAALEAQGSRIGGAAGTALLGEAVEACRAALRVRTEEAYPVDWAMTRNNLGNALQALAGRIRGTAGATLLGGAVEAFHAALRVRTEEAHPVDWAMTMENFGAAHELRAELEPQAAALAAAAACYEAALRVYEREELPYDHGTASAALARVRGKLAEL